MSQPSTSVEYPSIRTSTTVGPSSGHTASVGASIESESGVNTRRDDLGDHGDHITEGVQNDPNIRRRIYQSSPRSTSQAPSRSLGVHSILNPADFSSPDDRNVPERGSVFPDLQANAYQATFPSPQGRKRGDHSSPIHEQEVPHTNRTRRRVLTPKSPTTRAASPGGRRNTSLQATASRYQTQPAGESRIYTAEPGASRGSNIPPLPSFTNPIPTTLPNIRPNEPTAFTGHAHDTTSTARFPGDVRNIPQHTQAGQIAGDLRFTSAPPIPQIPSASYRSLSVGPSGASSHESQMRGPREGYQLGPASYQMTLDTDRGPMVVPVELDLQQASKVADEKRKRNAGASARFRARRKEKEKESSQTISGLQRELRELMEERDFYRNERNFFREIVNRQGQNPPRPLSPPPHTIVTVAGSTSEGSSTDRYRDQSEVIPGIQRRRTGDYQPVFGTQPALSPPVSSYSPPTSVYGTPFQSQPPLSLPPPTPTSAPYPSPRLLHPRPQGPPPPPLPSVSRSQSYDPFRRDPFDRNWNPGS